MIYHVYRKPSSSEPGNHFVQQTRIDAKTPVEAKLKAARRWKIVSDDVRCHSIEECRKEIITASWTRREGGTVFLGSGGYGRHRYQSRFLKDPEIENISEHFTDWVIQEKREIGGKKNLTRWMYVRGIVMHALRHVRDNEEDDWLQTFGLERMDLVWKEAKS